MPSAQSNSEPRVDDETPAQRRHQHRDAVAVQTTVHSALFSEPVEIDSLNLSPRGMFVRTDYLLPLGEPVMVQFRVPGTQHHVVVEATVVRAYRGRDAGLGLAFRGLPVIQQTVLRAALARWRMQHAPAFDTDGAFRC